MWSNGYTVDYIFDESAEPPPLSDNLIRILNACQSPVSYNVMLSRKGDISRHRIGGPMLSVGKQVALKYNKRWVRFLKEYIKNRLIKKYIISKIKLNFFPVCIFMIIN